jgi:6-phosphogluconolactonase
LRSRCQRPADRACTPCRSTNLDPLDDAGLQAAAATYAAILPQAFDLIHLGLGDDGHTASLVPGDPVLDIRDRLVGVTQPYRGWRRMTLTYPALDRARQILWIAVGEAKAAPLQMLRDRDAAIPASRISAANQLAIVDAFADPPAGSA